MTINAVAHVDGGDLKLGEEVIVSLDRGKELAWAVLEQVTGIGTSVASVLADKDWKKKFFSKLNDEIRTLFLLNGVLDDEQAEKVIDHAEDDTVLPNTVVHEFANLATESIQDSNQKDKAEKASVETLMPGRGELIGKFVRRLPRKRALFKAVSENGQIETLIVKTDADFEPQQQVILSDRKRITQKKTGLRHQERQIATIIKTS